VSSFTEAYREVYPAATVREIWWMRCAFCDAEKGKPHEKWCRHSQSDRGEQHE